MSDIIPRDCTCEYAIDGRWDNPKCLLLAAREAVKALETAKDALQTGIEQFGLEGQFNIAADVARIALASLRSKVGEE